MGAFLRFLAILAALVATPALAQPIADDGARVQQLADNVFVILHDDATDEWPHGNTGVIVGRESVFVIDSAYLPSRARDDIALIRRITDKPVRYLATTHWHFDHNNGAAAYREAFPDVALIAERNTARWIELNQTYWARMSTAPNSARRAALATLEAELAAGSGEDRVAFSAEERVRRQRVIEQRRNELTELESLRVITPETLFDGEWRLDFEGTEIVITDRGPANSPHDVTFYLPGPRILFMGDILVQSPLPFVGASWPVSWPGVLRQLEQIPAAYVVPGHGPVFTDFAYAAQMRTLLETVLARVEAGARQGKTLEELQNSLDLNDVRASVAVWNGPDVTDDDWTYIRRTLIERAWRGLRGQG